MTEASTKRVLVWIILAAIFALLNFGGQRTLVV